MVFRSNCPKIINGTNFFSTGHACMTSLGGGKRQQQDGGRRPPATHGRGRRYALVRDQLRGGCSSGPCMRLECENPFAGTAHALVQSAFSPRAVISELHVCPAVLCRVIQTAERDAALRGCLTSFPLGATRAGKGCPRYTYSCVVAPRAAVPHS